MKKIQFQKKFLHDFASKPTIVGVSAGANLGYLEFKMSGSGVVTPNTENLSDSNQLESISEIDDVKIMLNKNTQMVVADTKFNGLDSNDDAHLNINLSMTKEEYLSNKENLDEIIHKMVHSFKESFDTDNINFLTAENSIKNQIPKLQESIKDLYFKLEDQIKREEQLSQKEKAIEAVRLDGKTLEVLPEHLRNDREVVLEAVKQNGMSLEYASEELKKDKEIITEAMNQDGRAVNFVDREILEALQSESTNQNTNTEQISQEEQKNTEQDTSEPDHQEQDQPKAKVEDFGQVEYRNIYDDNLFDVHSVDDFDFQNLNFDVLAKDDENIYFEFSKDFWRYDTTSNELFHYPDFKSMKDNPHGGNKVYGEGWKHSKDYGIAIVENGLKDNEILSLPNFSLEDRENYFIDGIAKGKLTSAKGLSIPRGVQAQKQAQKTAEQITSALTENNKDLKPLKDVIDSYLTVISLFLIFSKRRKIQLEKENLVEEIMRKLAHKEISPLTVLNDKSIMNKHPELKEMIEKLIKENPYLVEAEQKEKIMNFLSDDSLGSHTEKLSEDQEYRESIGKQIFDRLKLKFDKEYNTDISKLMTEGFDKSPFKEWDLYVTNNIKSNFDQLALNNKQANSANFNLVNEFLCCLNPNNKSFENLTAFYANGNKIGGGGSMVGFIASVLEKALDVAVKPIQELDNEMKNHNEQKM